MLDAVILAGGKLGIDDTLYHESPHGSRSLIEFHGKPMAQWVIDALDKAASVADLYLIGVPADRGLKAVKPLHFLPDQSEMVENIRYGVLQSHQDHPDRQKALIVSTDIPAVEPYMIDWLAGQVADDPQQLLYYNVIQKETMEARFPNANRSYVHFKDISVCGGDLNAVDKNIFSAERPVWKKLSDARKTPLKQAGLIGIDTLLLVALRLITLETTVKRVCKRLDLDAKALVCPYAEMGMDADKPHQLAILRQHLQGVL
ncbi:MAG: NTP transferase domain-containing protein [Chloroflexi bacterium]|nr:NTP transferase domain-containing protein [Chloroflexota bacterium]